MLWSSVWENDDGEFPPLTKDEKDRIEYAIYLLSLQECDMNITVNPVITNTIEPSPGCCCGGTGGVQSPIPGVPQNPNVPYIPWPIPIDPDT
jgi:hypothetical protein